MFARWMPDAYFAHFYEITPEYLLANGIRALILDIDNTLVTYDDPVPTPQVCAWLEALRAAEIRFSFVSNNHRARVETFAQNTGCHFFAYDSHKPRCGALRRAMQAMQAGAGCTCAVGDQIFTDLWAARGAGIRMILVPPIKDRRDPLTKGKRLLEKPILRAFRKRQPAQCVALGTQDPA